MGNVVVASMQDARLTSTGKGLDPDSVRPAAIHLGNQDIDIRFVTGSGLRRIAIARYGATRAASCMRPAVRPMYEEPCVELR